MVSNIFHFHLYLGKIFQFRWVVQPPTSLLGNPRLEVGGPFSQRGKRRFFVIRLGSVYPFFWGEICWVKMEYVWSLGKDFPDEFMIEGFEWTICLTKSHFLNFQSMLKYQILSNYLMHGWFLVMRLSFTGAVTPDTRIPARPIWGSIAGVCHAEIWHGEGIQKGVYI